MTDNQATLAWLQLCCDDRRPRFARPFPIRHKRRLYAAATDGHVLLFVEGLSVPEPDEPAPPVREFLDDKSFSHLLVAPVSLADLRAWSECDLECYVRTTCFDCRGTQKAPCDSCESSGRVEHDCDCEHCTIEDDGPCPDCKGRGTFDCEECDGGWREEKADPVPGRICGLPVDRRLIYRLVRDAPGDTVRVGHCGELDPIAFIGDGWRALVMPVRGDETWGAGAVFLPAPVVHL